MVIIMRKHLLVLFFIALLLISGCRLNDREDYTDYEEESTYLLPKTSEPAMTIYNDSTIEISISYTSSDTTVMDEVILPDENTEIESGVTEITITGGKF